MFEDIQFDVILKHPLNFSHNHSFGSFRTFESHFYSNRTIDRYIPLHCIKHVLSYIDDQKRLDFWIDMKHPYVGAIWDEWNEWNANKNIVSFLQYLPEEVIIDCIEKIFIALKTKLIKMK
jgi:hypothetical protein